MSKSSFHANERVLSILTDALTKLKVGEGATDMCPRDIWLNSGPIKSENPPDQSLKDLNARIDDLSALKRAKEVLSTLAETLDVAIAQRKEEILPATRHHGLASLPNEVLLNVLHHVLYSGGDSFDNSYFIIRRISPVSRLFRQMVLAYKETWTFLELDILSIRAIDLYAQRSMTEPLSVRLIYSERWKEIVLHALKLRDRWTRLDAKFNTEDSVKLPVMTFPSVKKLRIAVDHDFRRERGVFAYWTFPNADQIELSNAIPRRNLEHQSFSIFRYVSEPGHFGKNGLLLHNLTRFLRPVTSLTVLHLDVSYITEPTVYEDHEFKVELPNLKEFYITNWKLEFMLPFTPPDETPMEPSRFAQIVRAIRMPNVENVAISLTFCNDKFNLAHWFKLAFRDSLMRQSVTRFSMRLMRTQSGEKEDVPIRLSINDVFNCFHHLQDLLLESHDFSIEFDFDRAKLAGGDLRHLRAFSINNIESSFSRFNSMISYLHSKRAKLEKIGLELKMKVDFDDSLIRHYYPDAEIEMARYAKSIVFY